MRQKCLRVQESERRLVLAYGPGYALTVRSKRNIGMVVGFKIPYPAPDAPVTNEQGTNF